MIKSFKTGPNNDQPRKVWPTCLTFCSSKFFMAQKFSYRMKGISSKTPSFWPRSRKDAQRPPNCLRFVFKRGYSIRSIVVRTFTLFNCEFIRHMKSRPSLLPTCIRNFACKCNTIYDPLIWTMHFAKRSDNDGQYGHLSAQSNTLSP